ncbi:MAG: YbaK/EbsC family protein [Candidatus Nanohaloarchaea archaeon]|nr:YbaK/EbsC family protein [Candidatus Nanohaloarchaea archaeon]
MKEKVKRLERFLNRSVVNGRVIEMSGEVSSADQAAEKLGTRPENIVKSLVFMVEEEPVVVVVPGNSRVSEEKLAELFEVEEEDVRIASPDEVEEITGYKVGEVPPVSLNLPKVVDNAVIGEEEVYGGGGSRHHLLEVDPRYLVDEDTTVDDVVR